MTSFVTIKAFLLKKKKKILKAEARDTDKIATC